MIEADVSTYLQRVYDCDCLNDMVVRLYDYYRVTGHTIQESSDFMNLYKKTADLYEANLKVMVAYSVEKNGIDLERIRMYYKRDWNPVLTHYGIRLKSTALENRHKAYCDLGERIDRRIEDEVGVDLSKSHLQTDSAELLDVADSVLRIIREEFENSSFDIPELVSRFQDDLVLAKKRSRILGGSKKETSEIDVLQINRYTAILQADPGAYGEMRMHSRQFKKMGVDGEVFGLVEDAQGLYANPKDLDAADIDTFNDYFSEILFTLDAVFVYFYQRGYSFLYSELLGLMLANQYQLVGLSGRYYWTRSQTNIPKGEYVVQRLGYQDVIDFRQAFSRIENLQEAADYLANFGFNAPFDGEKPTENETERTFMLNLGYVQFAPKKRKGRPSKKLLLPCYIRLDSYRPCFMPHEQRWELIGTLDSLEEQGIAVDKERMIEIFGSMDDASGTVRSIDSETDMKKRYNKIKIVLSHYGFVYATRNGRTVWTVTKRVRRYFENEYLPQAHSSSD